MMMNAFARLPQTVLMKFESAFFDTPKNVIVRKWLPQRDILEHKHGVAFVSHGGLASVMEAVQFAKPLVGVPFFADQFLNINTLVWKGAGAMINLDTMTEEQFSLAIDQVLNNPKYAEHMKKLSLQFRDRPQTALQKAVYWTEYVLRHQGAAQLRPASVNLPLHQQLLLDVMAVLLASLGITLYIFYYILSCLLSALWRNGSAKTGRLKKTN